MEYGDATFDGGVVSHYQCLGCGEELKCEPDDQSLYEYLKEMQKGQSSKTKQCFHQAVCQGEPQMIYDVSVSRISTATKTIQVEADSREEAEERAVE